MLIFVGYLNYLTDSYLMYAASAVAANTVARSAAGAAAPLFTQYMFDALGVGGGGSLIGGIACLLAPIPFIFYKYGGPIRKRSRFAPTNDDGPKKESQQVPRRASVDIEAAADSESDSESLSTSTTAASNLHGKESDDKKGEREGLESDEGIEGEGNDRFSGSKDPEKDLEGGLVDPPKPVVSH